MTELIERALKLLTAHRKAGKALPGETVREGGDLGGRVDPRHDVLQAGDGETVAADARKAGPALGAKRQR